MHKVLIIEDRRENIVFIANNILKPMGYDVITAMDGQTGLTKAREESPDLIITDVKLPGLGGLEVLEQLREKGVEIPAIVMTFHGTEETAMRALRLGARDYLIKPFTLEEMQTAVNRALKPLSAPALKPLSTATRQKEAAAQAKVSQLEKELAQMRATLTTREKQFNQMQQLLATHLKRVGTSEVAQTTQRLPVPAAEAKITQLEQELLQLRTALATRDRQLAHVQQQLGNYVKKSEVAEVTQRAAAWEEDNARLNQTLTQTKEMLAKAEGRTSSLEETLAAQQLQLNKYQEEAKRLADQLRNLSEAVRLLSQDLGQQAERLNSSTPHEKKR